MKTTNHIAKLPARYNNYTIEPCKRFPTEDCPGQFTFEECEPEEANIWTLYGQIPGIGVQIIGHFDTLPEAEEIFARITGSFYTVTSEPNVKSGLEVAALEFMTHRQIGAVWSIEDVQEIRPDLDDDQAGQVLQTVERRHDSNHGISWDLLEYFADKLYPQPDDE